MATKTVTMRLPESLYRTISSLAKEDNRPISNYIETIALRYIEESSLMDELELNSIQKNKNLMERIEKGHDSARKGKCKFV
jgi:predicted DNA-binding protein